jgi:hypothetical protein
MAVDPVETQRTGQTLIAWVVFGVVGWWLWKKVRS